MIIGLVGAKSPAMPEDFRGNRPSAHLPKLERERERVEVCVGTKQVFASLQLLLLYIKIKAV